MCETVIKIVLKKEAKITNCEDLVYWISNNRNVQDVKVEIEENGEYDLEEEAINRYAEASR
jgi:hypothetical protein